MITIERLSATNIKNLALKDTPFRRVTLVLGENGYGKTNLLRLLHCLLKSKEMPPERKSEAKFPIEGYAEEGDLLRYGESQATVSLTVHGKGDSYEDFRRTFVGTKDNLSDSTTLDFTLTEHRPGILVRVTAIRIGEKTVYPDPEPMKGSRRESPAELKAAAAAKKVESAKKAASTTKAGAAKKESKAPKADEELKRADLQKALEAWVRADLVGKTTYIPTARLLKRNMVPYQLERPATAVDDLENTILRLYTSKSEDPKALDRIRTVLKDFFVIEDVRPNLLAPEALPLVKGADGKYPPPPPPVAAEDLQVGIRVREGADQWFDLDHVGSGIQQVLAIVTMLEESRAKIALIEEFETSLSIKNRDKFLKQLMQLAGNEKPLDQIITSSHALFRPKQDELLSIGPDKPGKRDLVNFREWTEAKDWSDHTRLDK